jgi:hypothetical protein
MYQLKNICHTISCIFVHACLFALSTFNAWTKVRHVQGPQDFTLNKTCEQEKPNLSNAEIEIKFRLKYGTTKYQTNPNINQFSKVI